MGTYYRCYYDDYFQKFRFIKLPNDYIFKSTETYYYVYQMLV